MKIRKYTLPVCQLNQSPTAPRASTNYATYVLPTRSVALLMEKVTKSAFGSINYLPHPQILQATQPDHHEFLGFVGVRLIPPRLQLIPSRLVGTPTNFCST